MSSTASFSGITLQLQSVAPRPGYATLRVRFTQDPLQVSGAGVHDALNVANYTLVGPIGLHITGAVTVPGDTQSIDLTLSGTLVSGSWNLAAANIQTATGGTLQVPTNLDFIVLIISTQEPVSMGAQNDTPASVIRKFHNQSMTGKFWDGIIAGIATGDSTNWINGEGAFDQLWVSSASDIHLDQRAADRGLVRPDNVGMTDDAFRDYVIKLTNDKLTQHVMYEILEIFYGRDSVRAFTTCTAAEIYGLAAGSTLSVLLDELTLVNIVFRENEFVQISKATALEVAAAITRQFRIQGLKAFALPFFDPEVGQSFVRIYSASLGLGSAVRVVGGNAQNILIFPTLLLTNPPIGGVNPAETWAVSIPSFQRMRITRAGATTVDLSVVQIGDYVNVFGSNFNVNNQGSFPILKVDVRYVTGVLTQFIEVENTFAVVQGSVTTLGTNDLLFFRPTRFTTIGPRTVVVSEPEPEVLDIVLPATSLAVQRGPTTGAYVKSRPSLTPTSIERLAGTITAIFGTAHGLHQGDWVLVDDVFGGGTPTISAGNGTTTTDADPVSHWSNLANMSNVASFNTLALTLNDGTAFICGGSTGVGTVTNNACNFGISATTPIATGGNRYTYAWTAKTNMPVATGHPNGIVLQDSNQSGNVLVAGGDSTGNISGTAGFQTSYVYNVNSNTWSSNLPMVAQRSQHSLALLPTFESSKVVATGGSSDGTNSLASVEVFTPSATGGTWAAGASMARARSEHTSHTLSNGKVIVIGGRPVLTSYSAVMPFCEIYDPVGDSWSATGSMSYGRANHHSILLPNDQILVIGGNARPYSQPAVAAGPFTACEIYDGKLGRWNPFPDAPFAADGLFTRVTYAPTLNRVYVIIFGGPSTNTFYVNLTSRRWHRSAGFTDGRTSSALLTLGNGTMLNAGGVDLSLTPTRVSQLFDPESETVQSHDVNGLRQITVVPNSTTIQFSSNETGYVKNSNVIATITPATAVPSA